MSMFRNFADQMAATAAAAAAAAKKAKAENARQIFGANPRNIAQEVEFLGNQRGGGVLGKNGPCFLKPGAYLVNWHGFTGTLRGNILEVEKMIAKHLGPKQRGVTFAQAWSAAAQKALKAL
jgi:hypothetical protein